MHLLNKIILSLAIILSITSCHQKIKTEATSVNQQTLKYIQRFGMVTGLKPEKMEYYKKLHAAVWPAVQKKITECNIHNYSIYLKKVNGQWLLFSYFEYIGNDFDADMKKMADDSTTQRWWKETDPCQLPLPNAAAKNQVWSDMEEVFHEK